MIKGPRDHKQRPQNHLETLKFVKKSRSLILGWAWFHDSFLSLLCINKYAFHLSLSCHMVYIHFISRWDINVGSIVESRLKELHPLMPVMYIKALTQDKQEMRNLYECPVYKTRLRGPTYVWTFNVKTKERPSKWILAGVSLLLQI